ncbi:hypothetical protein EPO04_00530 [Patescibacteria group bacterium]|nr:MAG: hypothetical protein EPO04_00530 [Patescibacteria group bacterium]
MSVPELAEGHQLILNELKEAGSCGRRLTELVKLFDGDFETLVRCRDQLIEWGLVRREGDCSTSSFVLSDNGK